MIVRASLSMITATGTLYTYSEKVEGIRLRKEEEIKHCLCFRKIKSNLRTKCRVV